MLTFVISGHNLRAPVSGVARGNVKVKTATFPDRGVQSGWKIHVRDYQDRRWAVPRKSGQTLRWRSLTAPLATALN